MPEGPEIRTDADQLDFFLSNRTLISIKHISSTFEKRCKGVSELQKVLPLVVDKVRARGKKLFIFFRSNESSNPWFLVFGYGMTGNIGQVQQKHSHLEFCMGRSWIGFNSWFYSDIRRFGTFEASSDPKVLDCYFSEIAAPAVLGYRHEKNFKSISLSEFEENIKKFSNAFLAVKLMDQNSICSGIGNYILSEVLYEAHLDPFVKCKELDDEEMEALWNAIHKIMLSSYKHQGMSMSDYVNADGESGTFEDILSVYGKAGEFINNHKIHSCRGPHGRSIFFTSENGAETLRKMKSSDTQSSGETESEED